MDFRDLSVLMEGDAPRLAARDLNETAEGISSA